MVISTSQSNRFLPLLGRGIAVLVALLLLAGLTSYVFLDALAMRVARPLLKPYGIALESLQGLHINRHQVAVDTVQFYWEGAAELSVIEDLVLEFSATGFLALPVQQVHAERVSIALAEGDRLANATQAAPAVPDLPRLDTIVQSLDQVPANAIEIRRLDIAPYILAGRMTVQSEGQHLELQIQAQDTQITFDGHWGGDTRSSPATTPVDLDIAAAKIDGEVSVALFEQPLLSTQFTLTEQNLRWQLDGTSTWYFQPASTFALANDLLPEGVLGMDGTVNANWHVDLFTPEDLQPKIAFALRLEPDSRAQVALNLTAIPDLQQVASQLEQSMTVTGTYALEDAMFDLSLNAPNTLLTVQIAQQSPAHLALAVDAIRLHCDRDRLCNLTQESRLQFPELKWRDTQLQALLLVSNGSVARTQDRFEVILGQGSRLEVGQVSTAVGQLTDVNVLVQQALETALFDDSSLAMRSDGIDLYLPNILADGKNSHVVSALSAFTLHHDDTDTTVQAHAQLRNLGSEWLPFTLRKPELEIAIDGHNAQIGLRGQVRVADREIATVTADLDIANQEGGLQLTTPKIEFGTGSQSLSHWFFQPPFTADLIAGSAQASMDLQLSSDEAGHWRFNGPLALSLDALSGFIQDTAFIQLSTQLHGSVLDSAGFKSTQTGAFTLGSVDLGVAVNDVQFQYAIDTTASYIEVSDLHASLFGGTVASPGLRYDWSAPSNHLMLNIERIDLARMLDLAAYDSINASGFMSGTLPIRLSGMTPSIDSGNLAVEAPGGAIRYTSGSGTNSGNATLDFVNQALSNYQYDLMETAVEYLPTGELELGVRLQGHNPDLNNGQRINLNLNISDNIPALLRSLQAGRSIAETLERALAP